MPLLTGERVLTALEQQMLRIRLLEERLQELCDQGLGADWHFSKGQEAIPVGVCAALRDTDYVVAHHRTIAHAIAKGVPMEPLVAELLGKATGINGGRAGEMHMSYPEKRFMFSFQLVGTCVPVAAGLAWAVKNHLKTDDIVVVFHGDAATANGQWHEGVNLAAVQKLPLLLVCENNGVAGNVRAEHYLPKGIVDYLNNPHGAVLKDRLAGYGIESWNVFGSDVAIVNKWASKAAEYVRERQRPLFLNCDTVRLGKHKQGQGDIRTKEELADLTKRDPLRGLLDAPEREVLLKEINEAISAALAAPDPKE